jgi:hypothetical protein
VVVLWFLQAHGNFSGLIVQDPLAVICARTLVGNEVDTRTLSVVRHEMWT